MTRRGKPTFNTPAAARVSEFHLELIRLAGRAAGVSAQEAAYALSAGDKRARYCLEDMTQEGRVIKVHGGWNGKLVRWFVTPEHAATFANRPKSANPGSVSAVRAARRTSAQLGKSTGIDTRYQVDPQTYAGGSFSAAGPGRYLDEPGSCAARAASR